MKTAVICTILNVCPGYQRCESATFIRWSNSTDTRLADQGNTPLFAGSQLTSDGDIIQLGYFSNATAATPFSGDWVILQDVTIGHKGLTEPRDGLFSYSAGTFPAERILADVPLAIRFYDAPSVEGAGFFNTVSNSSGLWNVPNIPDSIHQMTITLSDSSLVWQDGPGSAFRTTIPVPEPDALALVAAAGMLALRRRTTGQ